MVITHQGLQFEGRVMVSPRTFEVDPNPFRPVLTPTNYNRKDNIGDALAEPEPQLFFTLPPSASQDLKFSTLHHYFPQTFA